MIRPVPNLPAEIYLDEIAATLQRTEVTLDLIEQSLGVLVWQGMPWWRRWAASWRDARSVITETEQEDEVAEDVGIGKPHTVYEPCVIGSDGQCHRMSHDHT